MDMDIPAFMGMPDFRRVNAVQPVFGGDFRGNIVVQSLQRIGHVTVFLDFPIHFIDVIVHQIHIGLGGNLSDLSVLLSIKDIGLGGFVKRRVQQHAFDDVLDLLDLRNRSRPQLMGQC